MEEIQIQFEKIYDHYVAKIYRFLYLKVGSRETAEDLSSEVFARAWKAYKAKAQIKNMQAYVYGVARNVLADHYKNKKVKLVSVEDGLDVSYPSDPIQEQAHIGLEMEKVQKALAKLNDDYQNLIIWRYVDELSIPEITQITGKSEESVRVGIHRALQSLKGKIGV